MPENFEEFDPSGEFKTVVQFFKDDDGRTIRCTRKFRLEKKRTAVKKSISERRGLKKFGNVNAMGIEKNVTYPDFQEIHLKLDGVKQEEKNESDAIIAQLSKQKIAPQEPGFLFAQSERARKELGMDEMAHGSRGRRLDDYPTVKVSNLSSFATEDDLRSLFGKFGYVTRVKIARSKKNDESRGYAFITFSEEREADNAIRTLNGYGYDNLILSVEKSKSAAEYARERQNKARTTGMRRQ